MGTLSNASLNEKDIVHSNIDFNSTTNCYESREHVWGTIMNVLRWRQAFYLHTIRYLTVSKDTKKWHLSEMKKTGYEVQRTSKIVLIFEVSNYILINGSFILSMLAILHLSDPSFQKCFLPVKQNKHVSFHTIIVITVVFKIPLWGLWDTGK